MYVTFNSQGLATLHDDDEEFHFAGFTADGTLAVFRNGQGSVSLPWETVTAIAV